MNHQSIVAFIWAVADLPRGDYKQHEYDDIVIDRKSNPKPDAALRDTENIPLKQDINEYFESRMKPYVSDAWMDHKKDEVGYEIPFTRYFYEYTPLRSNAAIFDDIRSLEASIADSLTKVGL